MRKRQGYFIGKITITLQTRMIKFEDIAQDFRVYSNAILFYSLSYAVLPIHAIFWSLLSASTVLNCYCDISVNAGHC